MEADWWSCFYELHEITSFDNVLVLRTRWPVRSYIERHYADMEAAREMMGAGGQQTVSTVEASSADDEDNKKRNGARPAMALSSQLTGLRLRIPFGSRIHRARVAGFRRKSARRTADEAVTWSGLRGKARTYSLEVL